MPGKRGAHGRTERRKEAKKRNRASEQSSPASLTAENFAVPDITENDLLAFQLSHFGDDTKPDLWFVDAETALAYEPAFDEEEDDGLGYYDDGVKRTLTDEQIEMFRHSEVEQLIRGGILKGEEAEEGEEEGEIIEDPEQPPTLDSAERAMSEASSIEEELLGVPVPTTLLPQTCKVGRQPSTTSRSNASQTSDNPKRRRKNEVPYDERKKRKWESYIEDIDTEHGSRTHRRIVRELDEQRIEDVDLEY